MKKAFTLIELAIVLVIVGLLVGGILQGQELIKSAQRHSIIKQIKEIDANANIFYTKYNGYPGDFKNATSFFSGTTWIHTVTNGNGDKGLDYPTERDQFWVHLDKSGLYTYRGGRTGDLNFPTLPNAWPLNKKSGWTYFDHAGTFDNLSFNYLYLWGYNNNGNSAEEGCFSGQDLLFIDLKIDDGLPLKGMVQGDDSYDSSTNVFGSCVSSSNYNINSETREDCIARFYLSM